MSAQGKADRSAVIEEIRAVVRTLVEAGADGKTICHSLALVAAEYGIHVTREPLAVLPVVIDAFMRSASKFAAADEAVHPGTERPPTGSTLH